MIPVEVHRHRDLRGKRGDRAVAFVDFGDDPVVRARARRSRTVAAQAAEHVAGGKGRLPQGRDQHRRRGRLAVGTADGDQLARAHRLGQGLAPPDEREPARRPRRKPGCAGPMAEEWITRSHSAGSGATATRSSSRSAAQLRIQGVVLPADRKPDWARKIARGATPIPPTPRQWTAARGAPEEGKRGGRSHAGRGLRWGGDRLQVAQHELERVRPVHPPQVAAEFPQQPVVEDHVEDLGVEPVRAVLVDGEAPALALEKGGVRALVVVRGVGIRDQDGGGLAADELGQRARAGPADTQVGGREQLGHPVAEGGEDRAQRRARLVAQLPDLRRRPCRVRSRNRPGCPRRPAGEARGRAQSFKDRRRPGCPPGSPGPSASGRAPGPPGPGPGAAGRSPGAPAVRHSARSGAEAGQRDPEGEVDAGSPERPGREWRGRAPGCTRAGRPARRGGVPARATGAEVKPPKPMTTSGRSRAGGAGRKGRRGAAKPGSGPAAADARRRRARHALEAQGRILLRSAGRRPSSG